MNRLACLLSIIFALLPFCIPTTGAQTRPNVLVIMVDDLGYSDLGCYGSEIETPNLDELAKKGLRFSQFYNTAKCHSSRVSLLTGQYCLAAGNTDMSHAVTSAEVLGSNGYFTAMTGKWHLQKQPTDFGFQRYFGHLSGACNFFKGDNTFRLNGEPWNVPPQGFYTTVANVDFGLKFLHQARESKKPWYLYVAFNAPHAPLHALPEDYEKYVGKYDEGWDIVRARRVARQKELGLFSVKSKPSPRPEHIPSWKDLESWRQKYEANRMTTLAAMIDRVDHEVGRLVSDLKKNGELDNTLILFVSDNGACPYDRRAPILNAIPTNGDVALGDSTGWAWARNTPFRYYKQNQFEGGISTPAIVHWPKGLKTKPGQIVNQPAHLIDVLPTIAEITKSKIPDTWPKRELREISGISLSPIFEDKPLERKQPLHFLFSTDRALRMGDWKIVSFKQKAWELYNMANDRTELADLSKKETARLQSMVKRWHYMTDNVLHAGKKHNGPVTKAKLPHKNPQWTDFESALPSADNGNRPNRVRKNKHLQIRARKNTKLEIIEGKLHLKFSGEDPGLAFDLRGYALPAGPYHVKFNLKGGSKDGGEIFFTVDPRTTLPRGKRIEFEIVSDGNSQIVDIELATRKSIKQLRIDVSEGKGTAVLDQLRLTDKDGKVLLRWPAGVR